MARELGTVQTGEQTTLRAENPWIWLYEVEVPTDPPTRFRLTNYTEDVEYGFDGASDPIIYSRFPVSAGDIVQGKDGDLPRIRVSVANATKEVGLVVDQYGGLVGQPAVVRVVNREAIDIPGSDIRWDAEVVRCSGGAEAITFELSAANLHDSEFPRWRYMSQHCIFAFGGVKCGYVIPSSPTNTVGGGFDHCEKHIVACEERGDDEDSRGVTVRHPMRFGGFRGMVNQ